MGSGTKPSASKTETQLWGLTGGIASGKSSVARFLEEAGLPVLDADRIARELSQEGGRAHPLILKRFGTADRAALRKIIFDDPKARKDLEAILHPLIGEESRRRAKEVAARTPAGKLPVLIYEASLLIEAGRLSELAGLIVVEAPIEARIARLRARDGGDEASARKILSAQLSDEERRKHADHIIVNSGSLEDLKSRTLELARKLGWTYA